MGDINNTASSKTANRDQSAMINTATAESTIGTHDPVRVDFTPG